jgi:ribosomal protein S18 acetylase RimI-like enzyme
MGTNEIFIRVEQNNTPAISIYEGLNYEAQAHEYFGVADTTILLKKKLTLPFDRNCTGDDTQPVLDYVL